MGRDLRFYESGKNPLSSQKHLSYYEANHITARLMHGHFIENILLENFSSSLIFVNLYREPISKNVYVADAKLVVDEDELTNLVSQYMIGRPRGDYFFSIGTLKDLHDGKVTEPHTGKPIDFFNYVQVALCLKSKVRDNFF